MAAVTINVDTNIDDIIAMQHVTVASGVATSQSSVDGITWVSRTMPSSSTWQSVVFGSGMAVAVSSTNGTVAASSPDGITWTARTLPSTSVWYDIAYGSGLFVAVSTNNSNKTAYSSDGITWTSGNISSTGNWRSVIYGSGQFIALSYNSNIFARSADGITWTSGSLPSTVNWNDVAYDWTLGRYVAVAYDSDITAYSDDGVNWTSGNIHSSSNWNWVTSNNLGRFVAVSAVAGVVGGYSNDGITWSSGTMPVTTTWQAVTYAPLGPNGPLWTANGLTTFAASSTNGINWVQRAQITMSCTASCYAPFSWRSNDTLTIDKRAIVTVNTDQKKFWSGSLTIINGRLKVINTSITDAIRFIMGRTTGILVHSIIPTNGQGIIDISGSMITIGQSSGVANQVFTAPYTDYIPTVWVETGPASGVYEMWNNTRAEYGNTLPGFDNGLNATCSGRRGMFFEQGVNTNYDESFVLLNSTTVVGLRIITVSSTTGIMTGASISGTNIQTGTVVEAILSATELEVNLAPTGSATTTTVTLFNPLKSQLTNQITFGDGTYGTIPPSGSYIKIPNIMVTSETAADVGNAQYATTGLSINLSFGGSAYLQNCLFDESYNNFTQGQNLTIKNVGMVIMPLLVEIYNLIIDGFAITQGGTYRRFYSTFWFTRDSRSNIGGLVLSYCNNAVMNDLYLSSQSFHVASPAFPLKLDFCKDVTLTNYRAVNITPLYNAINSCALYLYSSNNCTITGIEAYGIGAVFLSFSSNNTISNITWAEHVQFNSAGYTMTGDRLGYDPVTGSDLIEGQKYYIKLRTYHDRKREIYWDSKTYSFTPFLGAQLFPDYFACNCTVSQTVVLGWTNRSPVYLYEVFRSTALGFGTRDLTTLMYASTVAATVAFTNGPVTQAIPTAVTDTWTWNAAGKTLTRSAGTGTSFLTLGFILGMVVDVTETASNNGTFILSACTATVMTFANVGPYTQTIVAEAAAVIGKINGRTPANDTTYYYVLRKWDDAATSNESAETEVTPTANISSQNLIIQSDAFNTTWVAARITVTANQTSPFTTPLEVLPNTAATQLADKLAATGASGHISQGFTSVSGTTYTFSVFNRCDNIVGTPVVSGWVGLSGSATNYTVTHFVASGSWQRSSVTFTAVDTTTTAFIGVDTNTQYIYTCSAMLNSGVVAEPPIKTTTVAVTNTNTISRDISALQSWCRSYGNETRFSGLQYIVAPANNTGDLFTETYLGTSGTFVPSLLNRIRIIGDTTAWSFSLVISISYQSNDNIISNFTQLGRGAPYAFLYFTLMSNNNIVRNITLDCGFRAQGSVIQFATGSSNNRCQNFEFRGIKNYTTFTPYLFTNLAFDSFLENIRCDVTDFSVPLLLPNNSVFKGVAGGNATPANGAITWVHGSTTDGMPIAPVAVYDTNFFEMYHTPTSGALYLLFNDSIKDTPPYTILSGVPVFGNNGKLYFQSPEDSIEWEWPHKIIGVSGFANREPKISTVDLGTSTDVFEGLYGEYCVKAGTFGATYGSYKQMTAANLSSETISVSGFYIKIKLTAKQFMKYGAQTNPFVIGEWIKGNVSQASGMVTNDFDLGSTGTVWVSGVVGTFNPTEAIVKHSTGTTRATNVATNTLYALGPSYLSCINGLQIYTQIDQTVHYPLTTVNATLTITGLQADTEVRVYRTSDDVELAGSESVMTGTFTYDYEWNSTDGDTSVYIRIMSLTYKWMTYTDQLLGEDGLDILVQQVYDRNFENP
ncbi:MAG TPA: hypothetical protein VI911_11040 [Patescibacteria group bacterium]|nr:hypothetical protein [Patescibacteria group bacterium]